MTETATITQIEMQRAIRAARKEKCGLQLVKGKIIFVDSVNDGEILTPPVAKEPKGYL